MIVISRSHQDDELKEYLSAIGEHQTVAVGSSLKFCLVAEGKAQLYPRLDLLIHGILQRDTLLR